MKTMTAIKSIHLSAAQRQALAGALQYGLQKRDSFGMYNSQKRPQLALAASATLQALLQLDLIESSKFETSDYVATARGRLLGARLGISTKVDFVAPCTRAERAATLRRLTTPSTWACGDKESHAPRKLSRGLSRQYIWIEQLGYGHFKSEPDGTLRLEVTPKGQKLVSATDAPITIPLTAEMQGHLSAGTLTKVMHPDIGKPYRACNSISLGTVDHMESPRNLDQRLYDPHAVYPGTLVRLVDAKSGRLIATARTGEWDRIWFRANEAYGRAVFDMNYEYSRYEALDQYDRRIWVAFPHESNRDPEISDYTKADALAHQCGFNEKNSMRRTWLRRLPYRPVQSPSDKNTKSDFHGLLIDITGIVLKRKPVKRLARPADRFDSRAQDVGHNLSPRASSGSRASYSYRRARPSVVPRPPRSVLDRNSHLAGAAR